MGKICRVATGQCDLPERCDGLNGEVIVLITLFLALIELNFVEIN